MHESRLIILIPRGDIIQKIHISTFIQHTLEKGGNSAQFSSLSQLHQLTECCWVGLTIRWQFHGKESSKPIDIANGKVHSFEIGLSQRREISGLDPLLDEFINVHCEVGILESHGSSYLPLYKRSNSLRS